MTFIIGGTLQAVSIVLRALYRRLRGMANARDIHGRKPLVLATERAGKSRIAR